MSKRYFHVNKQSTRACQSKDANLGETFLKKEIISKKKHFRGSLQCTIGEMFPAYDHNFCFRVINCLSKELLVGSKNGIFNQQ